MDKARYNADIDGLRAIAVICVILFHLGFDTFSGGYIGVDVFFVISGFLITRLIKSKVDSGNFSFKDFYIRRARRLFPAFFFTSTASFVCGLLLFAPQHLERFAGALIFSILSLSNFYFWSESGYFDSSADLKPLLHTWSLGVEAQFYLLWPIALVLLLTKCSKYVTIVIIVLGGFLSLLVSEYFIYNSSTVFFLTPFRVFEFALGAILVWAKSHQPKNQLIFEPILLFGLSLIGYAVLSFDKNTEFPGINALIPCMGAALVIYSGTARYAGRLLTNTIAVRIGLISYSLYLLHWPILVFYGYLKFEELTNVEKYAILACSIIAAWLMHHFIEQPFRHGASSVNRLLPVSFVATCMVLSSMLLLPSAVVWMNKGWPTRSEHILNIENTEYGGYGFSWRGVLGKPENHTGFILYGDSHAKQYLAGLKPVFESEELTLEFILHTACLSFPNLTNLYNGKIHQSCVDLLADLKKATKGNTKTVIMAYRWPKTLVDLDGNNAKNGKKLSATEEAMYFKRLLLGIDRLMKEVGNNRHFIVIGNVPSANLKHGYLACGNRPIQNERCHKFYPIMQGEFFNFRSVLMHHAEKRSNVTFLDPYLPLCDDEQCYVVRGSKLYYSDHAHLSITGSTEVVNYFSDQLFRINRPAQNIAAR